ncbi:MAG TPA: DUF433 domain-containing protein [Trichormus sp. M33_DOE_039]|nr:DUF433 domain-containing protein [Trichormus sp. M33_DOE_039]
MTTPPTPVKNYIEQRDQGYWLAGTRISLDSVVYAFLNGDSPENIAQNFPLLCLEQVYGAIAFYLANRELVDAYLKEGEAEFAKLQQSLRDKNLLLSQKLQAAQYAFSYAVTISGTELGEAGSKCNTIICSGCKPIDS